MRTCSSVVPTFLSLPSELLYRIVSHLDLEERRVAHDHARCMFWVDHIRCALTVIICICRLDCGSVCKQLYAVITESSSLWHEIKFKHADFLPRVANPTYSARRTAFVQQRISAIRSVVVGPGLVSPSHVSACLMQGSARVKRV